MQRLSHAFLFFSPLFALAQTPAVTAFVNAAGGNTYAPGTLMRALGINLAGSTAGCTTSAGWPTNCAGTFVVFFDGARQLLAPLSGVSPGEVQFQIPYELPAVMTAVSVARIIGATSVGSPVIGLPIEAHAPALLTTQDGLTTIGQFRDQVNAAINSANPAVAGTLASLFAIGLGATTPAAASGTPPSTALPTAVTPVVTVGGLSAPVSFSMLVPGQVGIYQVRFRVPAATPSGLLPVQLTIGGRTSQTVSMPVGQGIPPFRFTYARELLEPASTLTLFLASVDAATGLVALNGADTRQPASPFTFAWGDGQTTTGFFPQGHRYPPGANYLITVTANYGGGQSGSEQLLVRLAAPVIRAASLPAGFEVLIATAGPPPSSRLLYNIPATLTPFAAADFGVTPRATIEYVLSVLAAGARDLVNGNLALVRGGFRQQIWKDSGGGFYSLWYADPPAIAAGNQGFAATIPWSSLAHEIGHNVTLNYPAGHFYGGKTDGNANAIYSETLAQIVQHTVIHEAANRAAAWGLGDDLAFELAQSGRASMGVVRQNYEAYVRAGRPFSTWNNPATPADEALPSFMTAAYVFLSAVEQAGGAYRASVKRLAAFLGRFNADWLSSYAPAQNTAQAELFRSTLLSAALSYGAGRDLRAGLRAQAFPIDDALFARLNSGLVTAVGTAGAGGEIAAGTWIEIQGEDLVPAATPAGGVVWNDAPEFRQGRMPVELNGLSVEVNGRPAYVYFYCSRVTTPACVRDQINVLTSLEAMSGVVEVVVKRGSNALPPFPTEARATAPSFFRFSPAGYAAATHADFSIVGPASLYPGYSTPAAPAETIVLWGTGFGPPQNALVEGSAAQSGVLPRYPECRIGDAEATVVYAGLASPGLYQLNVTVPAAAASGDLTLACTLGGASTAGGTLITVAH